MPRCQRTFRRLTSASVLPGTGINRWVCPHCAEQETYETLRDPDLIHYSALVSDVLIREFGTLPDSHFSLRLIRALRPECVREAEEKRYDLYLQRDADGRQMRLQIGHEMFHRVCSHGRIFHWTHEMFACLVSVRFLRRWGETEYADAMDSLYYAEAEKLDVRQMRSLDLWSLYPYPPGFYGRAYRTGMELTAAVGSRRLNQMLQIPSADGSPNIPLWLQSLPESEEKIVREILCLEQPISSYNNRDETIFGNGQPDEGVN